MSLQGCIDFFISRKALKVVVEERSAYVGLVYNRKYSLYGTITGDLNFHIFYADMTS